MKKKSLIIFIILITIINTILPVVNAAQIITKANLINDHKIETHIKKYEEGYSYEIKCNYICYKIDGNKYPAYCIEPGEHGVDEEGNYTVTIDDLLKDKLIYNTLLNGYPYKTPAQLGVETVDDAYVATKLAIKNVLLDRNVEEHYGEMDTKGEKIINAMSNIAEKGKAGNAVNKEATIAINKVGSLVEKEQYYYQEYSVSANVNISNYSIESLEGLPKECSITDVNGNKKEVFNSNQNFRINIPKSDFNKNIEGKINIIASCDTKPIFYGKASKADIQDYAITYKPSVEYKKSELLNIFTNTASIKIVKKDRETLKPIKDVAFSIYKENGEYIATQKTNSDGIVIFNKLYQGKYILKETEANSNYIKDDKIYEITTEYNKETTKTITNIHKKGNLKIVKVDKDNPDITLGAIEFDLINEEGKIIKHLTTDVNGEAEIKDINIGTYTLKETKTKREYNLCENKDIVVEWNKTSEIVVENEKKKGQIKVIKIDQDNNEIKLPNVEFEVIDKNNRIVEKIKTDNNGEAITSRLLIGEYKIKEVSLGGNTEYILNDETYIVKVEDNKVNEITIENEHKKGDLKIYKVDKDNNEIPLKDVEFEITHEDGFKYNVVTDERGVAEVKNIRTGKVTIKEIKTNELYELSKKEYKVNIEYNKCSDIKIENEKKKGQVEIYKVDKDNNQIKIPNVEFEILDKNNIVIDKLKTNEKGYAISKKIPIGEYYLKETKVNNKYLINEDIITINIKENVVVKLNIKNEKIKGRIQIIKSSSKDSPILNITKGDYIQGVKFEIYNSENTLVDSIITDENGQAISKEIEVGRYKVKEISTANNFILSTNEFFVNIEKNNEIKILNIENEPAIPQINIEKQGVEYAEKNEEIKYEFNIENKGNIKLDNFTWKEYVPEKVKVTKMVTGLYNENLDYNIYYKTNKSDYTLIKQANTLKSEYIDFDSLDLTKNEKIIEIKVEYGTVSSNFKSSLKPVIYAKVSENVKKDERIINETELFGSIDDIVIKDKSIYETIIKEKEILKKLPKTGC